MEPGDMVLYESHSVLHGRPFPLKGKFFANIFIHFEPTGHTLRHDAKMKGELVGKDDVHAEYQKAVKRRAGGHEADHSGLPSYIVEGTPEAKKWHQKHPDNERVSAAMELLRSFLKCNGFGFHILTPFSCTVKKKLELFKRALLRRTKQRRREMLRVWKRFLKF